MARAPLRSCTAAAMFAAFALLAGTVLAQSLPADLPLRRGSDPAAEAGTSLAGWLLLALVIGAGAYLAWRRGWIAAGSRAVHRPEHALNRISSHALTPQASVHVVQWNGDEYLVGCTSQQVTLLARRAMQAGGDVQP